MRKWLPGLMVLLALGFGVTTFSTAQEGEPTEPAPEEPAPPAPVVPGAEAGAVDTWQGEVLLKKAAGEEFEILAPVGEEKSLLHVGDTVRTGEGASITISLTDGTVIEMGPNSELVIEQTAEGTLTARLISGEADVTIGSESFTFICARHTMKGKDSRFQVQSPAPDTAVIFAIEEGLVVTNDYGLITYLNQGQKIEATFLEDEGLFQVSVHEYNEMDLKIEVHGEGRLIEPGVTFTVDDQLNIERPEGPTPPPKEPIVLDIPLELEDPEDEPFEDASDLEAIHLVSPSKP